MSGKVAKRPASRGRYSRVGAASGGSNLLGDLIGAAIRYPINNVRDSWREGHEAAPRRMSDMRVNAGQAPMGAILGRAPSLVSRVAQGGGGGPVRSPWTPEQFLREAVRLEKQHRRIPRDRRGNTPEAIIRLRRAAAEVARSGNLPPSHAKAWHPWELFRRGALASMPLDDWTRDRAWTLDR